MNLPAVRPLDWDSPLPDKKEAECKTWKDCLQVLSDFKISKAYLLTTLSTAGRKELHIFYDPLVKAVAKCNLHESYLK